MILEYLKKVHLYNGKGKIKQLMISPKTNY